MRSTTKLTLAFLPAFAALIALGVWQIQRLHWKEALIAQVNANIAASPLTLDEILALPPREAQYHRVTLHGTFDHALENYVFTADASGAPIYHVLTPLFAEGGPKGAAPWIMVDRGAVPKENLDPDTRRAGNSSGTATVTGVWRTPDAPNAFTPAPDHAHRIWYARDLADMARADGIKLLAPVVVEADATPNPGGLPKGGQTVVNFPNNHLQYAITWFGLAAALLGVFVAYQIQKR